MEVFYILVGIALLVAVTVVSTAFAKRIKSVDRSASRSSEASEEILKEMRAMRERLNNLEDALLDREKEKQFREMEKG